MPARSAGWNAVFMRLQLSLRSHLHIRGIHAEANAILFALYATVRIENCNIVDGLDVLTKQRMAEAELTDEIHLLLQRRIGGELCCRLRRREEKRGLELLFVRGDGVVGGGGAATESLRSVWTRAGELRHRLIPRARDGLGKLYA